MSYEHGGSEGEATRGTDEHEREHLHWLLLQHDFVVNESSEGNSPKRQSEARPLQDRMQAVSQGIQSHQTME